MLLEAKRIAAGASGGPGKRGVRANGRDPRELPLMRLAYGIWPELAAEIGASTGYERTGSLLLIENDSSGLQGSRVSAPSRRWAQEQMGIPTRFVEGVELREMEPKISEDVKCALYCPNDGAADHTAATRGLARAAAGRGAKIREGARAEELVLDGDRVTAVITDTKERIGVRRELLLLANTSVPELVRSQLGVTLPVWSILPQVLFTEPIAEVPVRHLIGHDHRTLAMKEASGNRVMISGGWSGRWNLGAGRGEVVPSHVEGNLREAVAVYPDLREVAVEESDAGRRESACVDGIPILDRLPGVRNVMVGTGWSGHGFAIAPAVNRLLADWVYGGERPEELRPFSYGRFLPNATRSRPEGGEGS